MTSMRFVSFFLVLVGGSFVELVEVNGSWHVHYDNIPIVVLQVRSGMYADCFR